ncbi:hypothetical protein PENSPDRAFT_59360 [Peniophora sp. CONT]|nr:hypothetical protein PENSPDRAFT_59360 [Peniophora sp. CONT]
MSFEQPDARMEEEEEEEEEWDEDEGMDEDDDEGSDDEDLQAFAQGMTANILAQINNIGAATLPPPAAPAVPESAPTPANDAHAPPPMPPLDEPMPDFGGDELMFAESPPRAETPRPVASKKILAALATARSLLALAGRNSLIKSMLSNLIIPGSDGANVYATLQGLSEQGHVPKDIARMLHPLLMALATSELLFPPKRAPQRPVAHPAPITSSPAPVSETTARSAPATTSTAQLQTLPASQPTTATAPAPAPTPYALHTQLHLASNAVLGSLDAASAQPFNPALIAQLQYPLYHAFLYASTAPAAPSLRELAALIQLTGVLAQVPIGGAPIPPYAPPPGTMWAPPPPPPLSDLATAVFGCNTPACGRVFSRLVALKTHEKRIHQPRADQVCTTCYASYSTPAQLAAHMRRHTAAPVWRCDACGRILPLRSLLDAHRTRGTGTPCASTLATELPRAPAEDTREVPPDELRAATGAVARLLAPLRAFISRHVPALALAVAASPSSPLADVTAKAQSLVEEGKDVKDVGEGVWAGCTPPGMSAEQNRLLGDALVGACVAVRRESERAAGREEEEDRAIEEALGVVG